MPDQDKSEARASSQRCQELFLPEQVHKDARSCSCLRVLSLPCSAKNWPLLVRIHAFMLSAQTPYVDPYPVRFTLSTRVLMSRSNRLISTSSTEARASGRKSFEALQTTFAVPMEERPVKDDQPDCDSSGRRSLVASYISNQFECVGSVTCRNSHLSDHQSNAMSHSHNTHAPHH